MFSIWKQKGKRASLFRRDRLISVVAQAAIGHEAVGDGRLLPLVILDTTRFPDLVDLFTIHETMPPGDADTTWATLDEFVDHFALILEFKKPFETYFVVDFDLTEFGPAVDLAMQGKAIYLQAGKPGDRLYRTMNAARIIVEIGASMPKKEWEGIWQRAIRNQLRKEGMPRGEAKRLSPEYMERIRTMFANFRAADPGLYVSMGNQSDEPSSSTG